MELKNEGGWLIEFGSQFIGLLLQAGGLDSGHGHSCIARNKRSRCFDRQRTSALGRKKRSCIAHNKVRDVSGKERPQ
jgi:hypothetical protein